MGIEWITSWFKNHKSNRKKVEGDEINPQPESIASFHNMNCSLLSVRMIMITLISNDNVKKIFYVSLQSSNIILINENFIKIFN